MEKMRLNFWLMALRPKTLGAAVVPVVVGTLLAFRFGHQVRWWLSAWALLSTLFIQIGTNLFNDVIDFKKGADTNQRLGPQRVTQSGAIAPAWVFGAGVFSFLLAIACGMPLVFQGGAVVIGIGILSLFFGYAYTGGPYPLAYKGLGDIFVVLFFGLVAVGGVYFIHTGEWNLKAVVAGLQVGFLATVMIAINNFRDIAQDKAAHKRTLAVRWGPRFARLEIRFLYVMSFGLSVYWLIVGCWGAALLPLMLWPGARGVIKQISVHDPGPVYNKLLARAGLIHLLFGLQLSLGFLIS